MDKRTIINIVSGKGGTGKTLFTAVIADMLGGQGIKTLVIDMDSFVRGLTSLLYFQKGKSLQLTQGEEKAVSDFLIEKNKFYKDFKPGIQRYRSFDVIPSVPRIDSILNINDIYPDTKQEAKKILDKLIESIPQEYSYIFLDSRAGYDELISATHEVSDISICIQEEDPISTVTAENLINQLEKESNKRIFRIINKARNIKSKNDLESKLSSNLSFLGHIPFDIDVMNSFGEKTFWDDISRTLYRYSVSKIWNKLSDLMELENKVPELRISPFGSSEFESRIGIVSVTDRILALYGLLFAIGGLIITVLGTELLTDPYRLASMIVSVLGIFMVLYVFLFKKKT